MGCCVPLCKNRSDNRQKGISFHCFPVDPEIKGVWIKTLNRENWSPGKYSRICSVHFEQSCFVIGKTKNILIDGAVPTICNSNQGEIKQNLQATESSGIERISNLDKTDIRISDVNSKTGQITRINHHNERHVKLLKSKLKKATKLAEIRLKRCKSLGKQLKRANATTTRLMNIISYLTRKGLEDHIQDHSLEAMDVENIAQNVLRQNSVKKEGVFLVIVRKNYV